MKGEHVKDRAWTQEQDRQETHIFGPLERRGVMAGWRMGQLVVVASGLLVDAVILRVAPSVGGLVIAVAIACVVVGMATVPVYGQSIEEWIPDVVSFVRALSAGHGRKVSLIPDRGMPCNLLYAAWDASVQDGQLAELGDGQLAGFANMQPGGASGRCPGPGPVSGPSPSSRQSRGGPEHDTSERRRHGLMQFSRAFPLLSPSRYPFDRFTIIEGYLDGGSGMAGDLDLHAAGGRYDVDGQQVGIIHDPRHSTYAAAFPVQPYGFLLDAPDEQRQKVRAWAFALASLAREGSPVHRVQWLARATPGSSQEMGSYYDAHQDPAASPIQRRSYEELLSRTTAGARRHELFIVFAVRAGSSWKRPGSSASLGEAACTRLLREMAAFKRKLQGVGGGVGPIMGADEYRQCIMDGWASEDITGGAGGGGRIGGISGGGGGGISEASGSSGTGRTGETSGSGETGGTGGAGGGGRTGGGGREGWPARKRERAVLAGGENGELHRASFPWPLATEEHWDCLRVESSWQSTYWVSQWPRMPVPSDFLSPLLLLPDVRFSFSMVMEPIAPLKAVRQVEQARTGYLADQELRQRGGFLRTERQAREHDTLIQREQELAEGHGQFRFSGYASVSAGTFEALCDARHRFEQAAGQAHVDTRPLYGRQLDGLGFTLPLARGLS